MTTHLNHRSTFFIDTFNIIFHIDLFLCNEIIYRMSTGDSELINLFSKSLPILKQYKSDHNRDIKIIQMCAAKKNQNVLLDLVDRENLKKNFPSHNLYEAMASIYYKLLTEPKCGEYIQMTEFGNTIKILTKDINFSKLSLYIPFHSKYIIDNIVDSFSGMGTSKVKILVGCKESLINSPYYDTYVFENVSDIDNYLFDKLKRRTEILIPNYEYNMMEDRTDAEKLIEQVTYQRLRLKRSLSEYREKGLSINTISVPI